MSDLHDNPSTPPSPARPLWRGRCALGVLLVLLTLCAYLPAFNTEFFWDDEAAILNEPVVHARDGIWRVWSSTDTPDYQPVMNSVRWAQWQIWGADARGYHATNILLHALSALLLWACLAALGVPGAWWAGAVFAVHPVCVASVAWAVELKNCLSQVLYLLALLAWLRFDSTGVRRWYAFALIAFAAALLSKGSVVVLPCVLLMCAWWRRGTIDRRDVLGALPFFALALAVGLLTIWFQERNAIAQGAVPHFTAASILARPGWVVGFYLYKALWPAHLCLVYPRWEIDGRALLSFVPDLLLIAVFAALCLRRRDWGRPFLFALGCFTLSLFPVMGFFRMYYTNYSLVADHWQYIALPAVIALVCGLAAYGAARMPEIARRGVGAAGAAALLLLAGLTWTESSYYRSSEALWRKTIRENPNAAIACENLGVLLAKRGETDDGLALLEKATHLAPDRAEFRAALADALLSATRAQQAEARYTEAAALAPDYGRAHLGIGRARLLQGDAAGAMRPLLQAERLMPRSAQVQFDLGMAHSQRGDPAKAAAHFRRATELRPDYTDAFINLGIALLQQRQAEPAEKALREAVRLQPRSTIAHWKLAEALAAQDKSTEALAEYGTALHIEGGVKGSLLAEAIDKRLRLYREWLSTHKPSSNTTTP